MLLIKDLILHLPKSKIIKSSLDNFGIIIITENLKNSNKLIDFIAPEHLHLQNKFR